MTNIEFNSAFDKMDADAREMLARLDAGRHVQSAILSLYTVRASVTFDCAMRAGYSWEHAMSLYREVTDARAYREAYSAFFVQQEADYKPRKNPLL